MLSCFDQPFRPLDGELRDAGVTLDIAVIGTGHQFCLRMRTPEISDLFRTFIDQQDDHMHLFVIFRNGLGDVMQQCRFPRARRGDDQPALAHAERLKALFGSAIASTLDERETIAVPQIGEEDEGHVTHVPKSLLVSIIAPRIEETFELVRNRLEASGFDKVAGRRVVLTGGACQLHGAREFAGLILDKQVRMGRPQRVVGLAEATGGPAFATTAGLLHFALSERAEVSGARRNPQGSRWGILGRLGHWLKDNF